MYGASYKRRKFDD
jgi:hypothetical protein